MGCRFHRCPSSVAESDVTGDEGTRIVLPRSSMCVKVGASDTQVVA